MRLKLLALCGALFLLLAGAHAQSSICSNIPSPCVTFAGKLAGSNGLPAQNYSIAFKPTQALVVAGLGYVVPSTSSCATDAIGNMVGVQNPQVAPVANSNLVGTLPPNTYYVEYTYVDYLSHETQASPETIVQVNSTGGITVQSPSSPLPYGIVSYNVYIGTTSGAETKQGSVTGSGSYSQSVPLVSGAALPSSNATTCQQVANDAAWPIGTGYNVTLTDVDGNSLPGYPMQWQLTGPGTTINVSNGLPYYHGVVYFPAPVLALPNNHATQSVSGNLDLGNYSITAGSINVTSFTNVVSEYSPVCDIRAFGATGNNPSHDDSQAIINGLAAGCQNFTAPPQQNASPLFPTTYYFDQTINAALRLDCGNRNLVVLRDGSTLGSHQLFHPVGTNLSHLQFFEVRNCTLQNGTNGTSTVVNKDVIRADYVDNIKIQHNVFNACAGAYCIVDKFANEVDIEDNIAVAWTYSFHSDGVEVTDVHFRRNYGIGGGTCTACSNPYFDQNGGENLGEGTFWVKRKWVEDNVLLNTAPGVYWEAYDSHGGEEITWRNNYAANVRHGVAVQTVSGYVSSPVCKNIVIEGNNLFATSSANFAAPALNGFGIVSSTNIDLSIPCENVTIENNYLNGFGGLAANLQSGAIEIYNSRNVNVLNNTVENALQSCLTPFYNVDGLKVDGLKCLNMDVANSGDPAHVAAIILPFYGVWNYKFDNITLSTTSTANAPPYMFYSSFQWHSGLIGKYASQGAQPTTSVFGGTGWAAASATVPTLHIGTFGDAVKDTSGIPHWYVNNTTGGYFSASATSPISVSGLIGNSFVTVSANTGADDRAIAPGACVNLPGMGIAAATLVAHVISNTGGANVGDTLTLDTPIVTSAAGQVLSYCGATYTSTLTRFASGSTALGTTLIGAGACAAAVTVSATGVLTTDKLEAYFSADPTGVTGYNGSLQIIAYPTANNVNFKVCNPTAGGITPGALTINWDDER